MIAFANKVDDNANHASSLLNRAVLKQELEMLEKLEASIGRGLQGREEASRHSPLSGEETSPSLSLKINTSDFRLWY